MSEFTVDGVEMQPTYEAVKITSNTVARIKDYVTQTIALDAKMQLLRTEKKEVKESFEAQGINTKAINRALAHYKRQKKLTEAEKEEIDLIAEIFETDAEIQAKITATL